jgi:N-acetylneuraminate synthase
LLQGHFISVEWKKPSRTLFEMTSNFRQICLETARQEIAPGRCLMIGEVAQTHDGSLGQAHAFIDAIANAGADAVKFQTHIAHAESTPDEPWRVNFSRKNESRFEYWKRMEFEPEEWSGLKEHAETRGLLFLSSPFSLKAVRLLRDIGLRVWKIASGEINNDVLLGEILKTKDAVILSSGMSDWNELDEAVRQVRENGNPLAVMQCTSRYPCPPEKIGLNVMDEMRDRYDCAVGLSDHSGTIYPGLAASAFGADVLEVHVTMSREMFGPDVPSSITTAELKELVSGVRFIERMVENPVEKTVASSELAPLRQIFTKSIYSSGFLPAGTVLNADHLELKKPGNGIPASQLPSLIGKKLRRSIQMDELLQLEDVES